MTTEKKCIYRLNAKDQESNNLSPFQLPIEKCHECQVLKDTGASDTTCYNTDQSEKECNISLQKR